MRPGPVQAILSIEQEPGRLAKKSTNLACSGADQRALGGRMGAIRTGSRLAFNYRRLFLE